MPASEALPSDAYSHRLIRRVIATSRQIERSLDWIVAALLFLIMWMVFLDVFMRYLFNAPIRSAHEIVKIGMAAVVFCALPLVSAHEEHVELDFHYRLMKARAVAIYRGVIQVLCAAACVVLAFQMATVGTTMLRSNEESAYLHLQMGYVAYGICVLVFVTALAHVGVALRKFLGINDTNAGQNADQT